jgi:hypothetical protein
MLRPVEGFPEIEPKEAAWLCVALFEVKTLKEYK